MTNTKENYIQILESENPDLIFSQSFQQENPQLQPSFADFFRKNYKQVSSAQQRTFSTNHVTYYFYKNETNNDVRMLRQESGCFHNNERFVSFDFIKKEIQNVEEERASCLNKIYYQDKTEEVNKHFDTQVNSLLKVVEMYSQLQESTPKLVVDSNATTEIKKPKMK